jgi:hypothetical protein
MFVRTTLVALVLASPAWADPEYPAGLFERSPLNDTPPAASRQGLVPPDKRKTRPGSEPVAAATTIVSGVIHGRNHAERIVHPQTLGEAADPSVEVTGSCKAPYSQGGRCAPGVRT